MTAIPLAFPPGAAPELAAAALVERGSVPLDLTPASPPAVAAPADPVVRLGSSVRVLLVEELDQVAAHISELLHEDEHVQLIETVHEGHLAMMRIAASAPNVVVIDALLQGKVSGLQLARDLRAAGADTPIIFMTVPDRPVRLNADMGIAEVVTLPLDGEALLGAISRVDDAYRGPLAVSASGTVAVFSGKGGVGRTTIAHNLAAALNQRPATGAVLVDGDLAHGDLRLHLGAPESAPSLLQLPTGHVTDADVAPLLWQDPSGTDVLLAPPRLEQADLILQRDVENALSILRRLHDVVVIDVPVVMNDMTLAMLDVADVVVDVVTTERGAVRKAQRCRAVLAAAGYPMGKIVTVVNRADARGAVSPALAAALGHEPDAWLPYEPRLAAGEIPDGSAVVLADRDAPVSRALAGLAELIAARVQGVPGMAATRAA